MQNDETKIKEVAEEVLKIERETRSNNNSANKAVAVNKILKLLEEVAKDDNKWVKIFKF